MRSRAALALLAVVVAFGCTIRLLNLDRAPFFGDELDHYYAASSLNAGEKPVLPSGETYDRGLEYTALVALSLRVFEDPEVAARAPSAAFGIVSLLLIAWIGWRLGGRWTAVWATFLLGVYPEAIQQSTQSRFYTYQMAWSLVALYAVWRAMGTIGRAEEGAAGGRKTWGWLGLAAVALYAALRVQRTTIPVLLAALLALSVSYLWNESLLNERAPGRVVRARALRLAAVLLIAGGVVVAVDFLTGAEGLRMTSYVPAWAGGTRGDPRFYYWALAAPFPLLLPLFPAILLVVALSRSWRLALLLGLWFGVPFALHSVVLAWKGERYLFAAIPALFLASGIAASAACGALRRAVETHLSRWTPHARAAASLALVVVVVAAVGGTPAVWDAMRPPVIEKDFDWRAAGRILEDRAQNRDAPFGSSMGLPALFYVGRLDFVVGTDFIENAGEGGGRHLPGAPLADWYSGVPLLTTPEAIRSRFPGVPAVFIAVDRHRWNFGNIDPALKDTLSRRADELCDGRCRDLMLFRWQIGASRGSSAIDATDGSGP